MPTYEYACRDCGTHLEVVQSFKDASLTECPSCSGQLRKVFSAAGIIFKGSGYYVNDTRSKPSSESSEKTSDKTSEQAGSETTKAAKDAKDAPSEKKADAAPKEKKAESKPAAKKSA